MKGNKFSKSQRPFLLNNNYQQISNAYSVLGMVLSILHRFLIFNVFLEQLQEEFHSYYNQISHVKKLEHRKGYIICSEPQD